jgi:DNA-binding transcriptional MerR regulator
VSEKTLTVGQLARDAGLSPQILRHYERLGLLRPRRTAAGYRVYAAADRARLDVIRTLRELDVDLATIGRVLRGTTGVRAVAELHINTLEHQARMIRRRAAVLRASLRHGGELDVPRIQRLHALVRLDRADKARFVAEQLGKRMAESGPPALQRAIMDAARVELPDDATVEQLDAWIELAELVSDDTFLAHHRVKRQAVGAPSPAVIRAQEHALREIHNGVEPNDKPARMIAQRWVRGLARQQGRTDVRAFAEELCRAADSGRFDKEQRFWALLAILKPEMGRHPAYVVGPWLMRALRAQLSARRVSVSVGDSTSRPAR